VAAVAAALTLVHVPVAGAYTASGADRRAESTPLNLGGSATQHAASSANTGGSIVRTLIALVLVVSLIYAVTWILRKIKRHEGKAVGSGLQSVASLPLAPGRSLALVRAGSDFVLVGVAEQQVTPIRRYTVEEAREAGLLDDDDDDDLLVGSATAGRVDTLSPERARRLHTSMGGEHPRVPPAVRGALDALKRWTVRS
jgi:flagellar protein FliO/FliZ